MLVQLFEVINDEKAVWCRQANNMSGGSAGIVSTASGQEGAN